MSAQSMLEQLFKSGMSLLDGKGKGNAAGAASAIKSSMNWGQFGGGAATGGALGLLLGSKRGRSFGGKVLQYGSVAALGVMAFKAYSVWQQKQGASAPSQPPLQAGFPAELAQVRTVDRLSAPQVEAHSQAMLLAMIAAAKSDGHLDERERGVVEAELARLDADPVMRNWFEDQLRRPLDPAEIALAATTPELASEMYLASLLVVDESSFMERAYLDELARQLRLPEGLKQALEEQALAVA
ncbi:tellurite resistance TerB family protein [Actimicrobium sp. CCI2.3]|uniref:tellurite resistance TerB family protein n=1 Tax=Actimicrobium sp. CCI2.3 TaxID=3048616 RepID=UPI002AB5A2CF|nr:tellurite resistance TerB family protein [Actimicrobium sp. CCI2.3]MDY7574189.1 tellurite resistance TerB family protein [Actimicrobium sp. CCI2.3]MEB0023846.1 tellurite resistance TerB family protein [Actimicrobium sp. CCI2.3]